MSVVSKAVIQACKRNGLQYSVVDSQNLVISIVFSGKNNQTSTHLVIANNLGLNSSSVDKLCTDKFFTYQLLQSQIDMPETRAWVDPLAPEPYINFSQNKSRDEIVTKISELLQKYEKLVLKPNSKSRGMNVFVCESYDQVRRAVDKIFDLDSYMYDHVLIAQEYVSIKNEYRVIVFNKEIQFMYLKNNRAVDARFVGNVSPLHYENATADLVKNKNFFNKVEAWLRPIFKKLELVYAGVDIVELSNGRLQLLEINSQPGYTLYLKQNNSDELDKLLDIVFASLKREYEAK